MNNSASTQKKQYYSLEEAAHLTGLSRDDLIHFGATGKIKIWALADGWLVNFYAIDLIEGHSGTARGDEVKKSLTPYRISGPVQLYAETLVRIEANPDAKATRFVAPFSPEADLDHDIYEYRACTESSIDEQPYSIEIGKCRLVVFNEDLGELIKTDSLHDEKPIETRERRSMHLIIAALAHINGMDLKKPSKTALMIKNQMDHMHEHISQKAIEDHLNKIPSDFKVTNSGIPPAIS